jgi:hypothetical protein
LDAAMSVLSDQHWADPIAGLAEMARVARRVVVFHPARFWLTRDYLPELAHPSQGVPTLAERAAAPGTRMEVVPVPWDCADGFFHAYWRRPRAYLRPEVRQASSVWARSGPPPSSAPSTNSVTTSARAGGPRATARSPGLSEIDLGARLLIAERSADPGKEAVADVRSA